MIYAILKKDGSGIVKGISDLAGEVTDPLMIEISEYDESIMGKKWENGQFVAVEAPKRKQLTRYEFRSQFTFEEQVAITLAAKSDVVIEVFMKSMEVAEAVNLDYPETAQGLTYLVKSGLITQEKMDNILKGV